MISCSLAMVYGAWNHQSLTGIFALASFAIAHDVLLPISVPYITHHEICISYPNWVLLSIWSLVIFCFGDLDVLKCDLLDPVKENRDFEVLEHLDDNTPDRLLVKEQCALACAKRLRRSLS